MHGPVARRQQFPLAFASLVAECYVDPMTTTPRDTGRAKLPEPSGPARPARKVGTSMAIDSRNILGLDALADLRATSRSKLIQQAIKEFLERQGYTAEWDDKSDSWHIVVAQGPADKPTVVHRWISPNELPMTRRPELP